jgi:hypothetical protein
MVDGGVVRGDFGGNGRVPVEFREPGIYSGPRLGAGSIIGLS